MRVGLFFALFIFVALFILFWNIKKWKWSVAKMVFTAGGCAIISGSLLSGVIYLLIQIG